jgi:SEC-C motif-containing protein
LRHDVKLDENALMGKKKNGVAIDGARACPCGAVAYASCCERFHRGALPETAEQLMRARYSAYVLGEWEFLHRTWDERTRPSLAELQGDGDTQWLGLEVRRHAAQQDQASVEFVARFKVKGRAHRLHEVSRFERNQGQWYYVDGSFPEGT